MKKQILLLNLIIFITLGLYASISSRKKAPTPHWFTETIHYNNGWAQTFRIDEMLFEEKTDFQHLMIFRNEMFGTVMVLDGIVQTTERDEYIYHEMIVHTPMLHHGNAKKVLIIGGGDGGSLREVLRHKGVEKAVLVDIDNSVIELSKKYFPHHSEGAFQDPRAEIIIADGCQYVKNTQEKFDVIICDTTDPIGCGEALFTEEFFTDCSKLLTQNGIFTNQNEVCMGRSTLIESDAKLKKAFKEVKAFFAPIPTYIGGFMSFGWATNKQSDISLNELKKRAQTIQPQLKYYTPDIHKASFALPNEYTNKLGNSST